LTRVGMRHLDLSFLTAAAKRETRTAAWLREISAPVFDNTAKPN